MNPYVSTHPATAPYYREARVTLPRRQTACGMRHCCARRIDEAGGRRKLGCTSTRSAERQRIIGAEANRIAMLTRLCRAQAISFRRQKGHSSLRLPIKSLSLGVPKGPFSFAKENGPLDLHPCAVAGTPLPHSAGVSSILLINRQPKRQFDTKLLSLLSFLLILGPRLIIVRRHAEQR